MSKATKILLIVAASALLLGLVLFVGGMTMLKWDFLKLSIVKHEVNEHNITENFSDISIKANTADIVVKPTDADNASVICHERENQRHTVEVKNGVLSVEVVDNLKWYENIGIISSSPKIEIFLPVGDYGAFSAKLSTGDVNVSKDFVFASIDIETTTGDITNCASTPGALKISADTGDINVAQISASEVAMSVRTGDITVSGINSLGNVSVNVTTGRVKMTDVRCKNFASSGGTGDIILNNVIAAESFDIERTTGKVKLDSCDCGEGNIGTGTGDVAGSLLTSKIFIVNTKTGDVTVPKTLEGGKFEVNTTTGDIKITIK